MGELRKKPDQDLESLALELEEELTDRYSLADVTSKKKGFIFALSLILLALLVLGISLFFFYKSPKSLISQEHQPKIYRIKLKLEELQAKPGEEVREWTYEEFMTFSDDGLDLESFVDKYGKPSLISQADAHDIEMAHITYGYQVTFNFVAEGGIYKLVGRGSLDLLRDTLEDKGQVQKLAWSQEAYQALSTDSDQGEELGVILDRYGAPLFDFGQIYDGVQEWTVAYPSYEDGQSLVFRFKENESGEIRLYQKEIQIDSNG